MLGLAESKHYVKRVPPVDRINMQFPDLFLIRMSPSPVLNRMFMGRSTKKRKSQQCQLSIQQRLIRWCFRPRHLVPAALLALAALFWPQMKQQLPELESQPEYQVTVDQITVTPPPRWVPEDLVADVLHRVRLDEPLSLQESTLSERIAAAFVTHPWIQKVHSVRKSFPARVHVDVTYRKPVAMVEGIDGFYPLDAEGCVLPVNLSPWDVRRLPVIENVSSVPQGGQGQPWGDPVVAEAAQLADVLFQPVEESGRSRWETWGLVAIEVPSVVGLPDEVRELQFQFRTVGGSRIVWGRGPRTQHPGEITVGQKLQRMAEYHEVHGSFDDAPEAYVFDLREWKGISRRLATDQPAARQ